MPRQTAATSPRTMKHFPLLTLGALLCVASPSRAQDVKPQAKLATPAQSAAFDKAMGDKANAALKNYDTAIAGRDGWLFFAPELRHLGTGDWWGKEAAKNTQSIEAKNADPIPAILDFKRQLDSKNIALLLVPVPPKAIVYPDKIWATPVDGARLDARHREFYDLLRAQGVDVLDLTDDFIAARAGETDPVYCRTDTHWAGRATVIAAQQIKDEIEKQNWLDGAKPKPLDLVSAWKRVPIQGDLWLARPAAARGPQEEVLLRFVGAKASGANVPLPEDANSPVVLLGDSHSLVFHEGGDMHTRGAGLADQLALELGFGIDVVAVRGSGATPARVNLLRRARKDANYLAHKKVVVWCFSAREWSESLGWDIVPVVQ